MKRKVNMTIKIILMLSLIISFYFSYQYIKLKEEQQHDYNVFLNHYYFAVEDSLRNLNKILDKDLPGEQLNHNLTGLAVNLHEIEYITSDAAGFIDGITPSGINIFRMAADVLTYGTEYNKKHIPPFGKDNQLSQSEKAYLLSIREHLEYIKGQLYSEKTEQENPELNKDTFNKLAGYLTGLASEHYISLNEYLLHKD